MTVILLFQCDNELKYWDGGTSGPGRPAPHGGAISDVLPAQLEAVISEVRRLEETASKNEEELSVIMDDRGNAKNGSSGGGIRGELDQLKHRLGRFDFFQQIDIIHTLQRGQFTWEKT